MANQTITTLKYANLQMAAEALYGLKSTTPGTIRSLPTIGQQFLTDGNDHASRFTTTQATEFAKEWKVVEHISNTKTGFSGTLFECLKDDEAKGLKQGDLVLSFRSTAFIDDSARDNQATNALEIKEMGFAFGQIADMSDWFEKLNADTSKLGGGKSFAVTGYSLGGHLATAFNALYGGTGRIKETYTFNGAGVGLVKSGRNLNEIIDTFNKERRDGATGGDTSGWVNGGGSSGIKFFNDPAVQTIYEGLRDKLKGGTRVTSVDYANLVALPFVIVNAEAQMLIQALNRIKLIQEEFDRLNTVDGPGSEKPQDVALSNIEAMNLSYQVAANDDSYAITPEERQAA